MTSLRLVAVPHSKLLPRTPRGADEQDAQVLALESLLPVDGSAAGFFERRAGEGNTFSGAGDELDCYNGCDP